MCACRLHVWNVGFPNPLQLAWIKMLVYQLPYIAFGQNNRIGKNVSLSLHYSDVIMSMMTSQITCLTTVYSTIYSGADRRKHQSSSSLAFVRGIHLWPVNSPHKKGPVTLKMFPFDDVITLGPGECLATSNHYAGLTLTIKQHGQYHVILLCYDHQTNHAQGRHGRWQAVAFIEIIGIVIKMYLVMVMEKMKIREPMASLLCKVQSYSHWMFFLIQVAPTNFI